MPDPFGRRLVSRVVFDGGPLVQVAYVLETGDGEWRQDCSAYLLDAELTAHAGGQWGNADILAVGGFDGWAEP